MSSYGSFQNPSQTATMVATLRIPGQRPKETRVAPGDYLVVVGEVIWPLWELRWEERRKGLMRFGRG